MATMKIEFDKSDIAEVKRLFASTDKLYNQVAYRAMGKVVAGVKTDADAEIRTIYNLKKSKVSSGIYTTKGSYEKPAMTVTVGKRGDESAQPISLINFAARQVKKGVSVQVLKAKPREVVGHVFIGRGRNANQHVFGRAYRWTKQGAPISRPNKTINPNLSYGSLPMKYRQPVYKKKGPRLADVFTGRPQVHDTIKRKAVERLRKELDYQYDLAFKNL